MVPEPALAVVGGTAAAALSYEPHVHETEPGMLCDRCLQPIDADAFRANVERLQVRWKDVGL